MNDTQRDPDQESPDFPRALLGLIVAGLLCWSLYLTIGAFLHAPNLSRGSIKAAIVFGSMLAFLAFWWTMIVLHRKREKK